MLKNSTLQKYTYQSALTLFLNQYCYERYFIILRFLIYFVVDSAAVKLFINSELDVILYAIMLDINIVMALNILFSQYLNVSRSKVVCALLRLYCIFSLIYATFYSIVYICFLYQNDPKGVSYNMLITIQFIFWTMASLTSSENYISTYTRAIFSCDSFMGYTKLVIQTKYMFTFTMLCIFLSLLSLFFDAFVSQFWTSWFAKTGSTVLNLLSQWFINQSLELPLLRLFVVVGLLQNRLMKLRKALEKDITVSEGINGENYTEIKMNVVRKCIITYKSLLDAFDNVYGHMHRIVSTCYYFKCLFHDL